METNLFRYVWQKSRGEQIVVLLIILASIPFYWASFDVPKRIVNDAIQGGAFKDGKTHARRCSTFTCACRTSSAAPSYTLFDGFQVGQLGLLLGLSVLFPAARADQRRASNTSSTCARAFSASACCGACATTCSAS